MKFHNHTHKLYTHKLYTKTLYNFIFKFVMYFLYYQRILARAHDNLLVRFNGELLWLMVYVANSKYQSSIPASKNGSVDVRIL